ncbi:hypothetical protein [Rhodoferax aquaticus]|nr:hypothetical protein [Rhodoferax aquaticus]
MKILAVTHELSFSGAPLALLEFARALTSAGHHVDVISLSSDAGLGHSFLEAGARLITGPVVFDEYDLTIFNSIVTVRHIPRYKTTSKIIAWIHESPYLKDIGWRRDIDVPAVSYADAIMFPSASTRQEWSSFIELKNSFHFFSPIIIRDGVKSTKTTDHSPGQAYKICVIDPREDYRCLERIEGFFKGSAFPLEIHFVGAQRGEVDVNSSVVSSIYYGRVPPHEAIAILASCDVYVSATCLATQNRGFCEALLLGKRVYVSSISAHREIGNIVGLEPANYFQPLDEFSIDFTKGLSTQYSGLDFFSPSIFEKNVARVLDHCGLKM